MSEGSQGWASTSSTAHAHGGAGGAVHGCEGLRGRKMCGGGACVRCQGAGVMSEGSQGWALMSSTAYAWNERDITGASACTRHTVQGR